MGLCEQVRESVDDLVGYGSLEDDSFGDVLIIATSFTIRAQHRRRRKHVKVFLRIRCGRGTLMVIIAVE